MDSLDFMDSMEVTDSMESMDSMIPWNELTVQKNENLGFHEKHSFDWQIPSQSEMFMKT